MTEPIVEVKAVEPDNKAAAPAKPRKPRKPAAPKDDRVTLVSPSGREYRTSKAEAARLVRTAGYRHV